MKSFILFCVFLFPYLLHAETGLDAEYIEISYIRKGSTQGRNVNKPRQPHISLNVFIILTVSKEGNIVVREFVAGNRITFYRGEIKSGVIDQFFTQLEKLNLQNAGNHDPYGGINQPGHFRGRMSGVNIARYIGTDASLYKLVRNVAEDFVKEIQTQLKPIEPDEN